MRADARIRASRAGARYCGAVSEPPDPSPAPLARARGAPHGPLPTGLRWLGRLAEPLYGAVIASRNRAFDAGQGVRRVGVPVISVGNLTVGGTGKTPMVIHLVRQLMAAGRRPCIAMRGYVPRGAKEAVEAPDESLVYAAALPDVPRAVGPERFDRICAEISRDPSIDCVVLDDGFQHRRLARDLDVVLVDASADVFGQRLLPAGWLREPVSSLARAGAVVITHAELVGPDELAALERGIERACGRAPVAVVSHRWTGLVERMGASGGAAGIEHEHPVSWLRGKRVLGVCAIGNPRGFHAALKGVIEGSGGAGSMRMIALPDHDPFGPSTRRKMVESAQQFGAQVVVVTEKDWVKLSSVPASDWPCPLVRTKLSLVFQRGEDELRRRLLDTVNASKPAAHAKLPS